MRATPRASAKWGLAPSSQCLDMRDATSAALVDCQFGQAVESRNSSSKLHGLRTTQATRWCGRRTRHFLITHDCHREAAAALRARIWDLRRARASAGKRPRLLPLNGKAGLLRSGGMIKLWQLKVQPPSRILPEFAIGPSRQVLLACLRASECRRLGFPAIWG